MYFHNSSVAFAIAVFLANYWTKLQACRRHGCNTIIDEDYAHAIRQSQWVAQDRGSALG